VHTQASFTPDAGELFAHLGLGFVELDLDQPIRMYRPDSKAVPGCLTGAECS
jgi:hypothetical protein